MDLSKVLKNSELTLSQDFYLVKQKEEALKASKTDLIEALIQTTKLLMIKDNMLKQYMKYDLDNGL